MFHVKRAKSAYICRQGGPGAPGLKGDGGDSGPPVRTPSCPLDQATSIGVRLVTGIVRLYVYFFFFFKGTQRSSGCNWYAWKIRKEGNCVVFLFLRFLRCNNDEFNLTLMSFQRTEPHPNFYFNSESKLISNLFTSEDGWCRI